MGNDDFWRKHFDWMSDDQYECFEMLCELFGGAHHVLGKVKPCGEGIMINSQNGNWAASFDFDGLTRAVVMAHDRMIRFSIEPSGPGMLQLRFHKRHQREGRMHERHPTIEEAIANVRERHGGPVVLNKQTGGWGVTLEEFARGATEKAVELQAESAALKARVADLVEALEDISASWHSAGTRARARNALAAHRAIAENTCTSNNNRPIILAHNKTDR